ncbi:MAG: hypothetical protein WDO73_07995 [Ignavibacteriota bacterium]
MGSVGHPARALTMVFSYRVSQMNSTFTIGVKDLKREIVAGYSVKCSSIRHTHKVTRLIEVAQDIPPDFPVHHAQERLDYDYADIGGQQYLLPYRGELIMEGEEVFSKNLLDSSTTRSTAPIRQLLTIFPRIYRFRVELQEAPAVKGQVDCKDPKKQGRCRV